MRNFLLSLLSGVVLFYMNAPAWADFEEDYEKASWKEVQYQLPPAPAVDRLIPFYVSAATEHRSFVDSSSLTVGEDGVVRFVLVVVTAGGARNVSFEGMRCQTGERRIYASGRLDGSWSKARKNEWVPIREAVVNRQYAALYHDYFCPAGIAARNAAEAVLALRSGGHPDNRR